MKDDLFPVDESETKPSMMKDMDADRPEDSDLLDMIGKDSSEEVQLEETVRVKKQAAASGPFLLESLYFRSFGERPLLTREEETELAKRIDQGSRLVRSAVHQLLKVLSKIKRSEVVAESQRTLQEIRRLSGLSASVLDKVETSVSGVLISGVGTGKSAGRLSKQLKEHLAAIRDARKILESAKDELVRCNLRLVVDVAKHYTRRGLTLLDLVQEGNIGLMKAAERYQYRKGFKFSTYATWWIRQGITRALADQARTIRIPVHQTEASHRILRVTRRLGQQLGRPARLEEIASVLRMRPERLHETVQAFQEPVALEHPVGDGSTEFGELLPDLQAVPPDAHVHRTEMANQLDRILSTLTPREQTVIRLRFGIGHDQPSTLEQVGQNLSVTRERIRQIEAKALKKLKTPAIKEMFAAIQ
ncbi:RNA polymerase sigma factor [Nitrospira sp. KM1]|uniref:RNA polymerase sigma factor RpoD/SigA n=1 Tax=Nitrospira sp. KM1 TaxID=1936990 RepID=UPI0013A77D9A|nr:sigma-70 family RNA polymerase sigma factor [Nitrospira sp. KM1]BCA55581.1 RNA polymerase sigma factor [Nitrospira sp. KM1]